MSGKNVESAAMSTLFGQYEDHVKRAEHGHQLNTSLLTAMTSHTSNLKMLALPPDELLSRLASARPEKSKSMLNCDAVSLNASCFGA